MPNGFSVQLDKLENFTTHVSTVANNYSLIVDQLAAADLNNQMDRLLSHPEDLGSSGPPVAFAKSSKTMLTDYNSLLQTLHQVHVAIEAQFNHMKVALGETRQLYGELDDTHANTFQNLLPDAMTDGR